MMTRDQIEQTGDEPRCPRCGSIMWDNRATKRNPRAPDYRCRRTSCPGAIWKLETRKGS